MRNDGCGSLRDLSRIFSYHVPCVQISNIYDIPKAEDFEDDTSQSTNTVINSVVAKDIYSNPDMRLGGEEDIKPASKHDENKQNEQHVPSESAVPSDLPGTHDLEDLSNQAAHHAHRSTSQSTPVSGLPSQHQEQGIL